MSTSKKPSSLPSPGASEADVRFVALGELIAKALNEADALDQAMLGIRLQEAINVWRDSAQERNLID